MTEIVNIDHETGDLSQYSSTVTDGGDLSVLGGVAALIDSFGLSCLIDDTTAIYGQINITAPTSGELRVRFYIDPTSLTMAGGDNTIICEYSDDGGSPAILAGARFSYSGGHRIAGFIFDDSSSYSEATPVSITDAPHYVEFYVQRASSAVANDGRFDIWIDGINQQTITSIDNYDTFAAGDNIRLGATVSIDAGTSGTFYLDNLVANDDGNEIGAVLTVLDIDHETGDLSQYTTTVTDGGDLSVTNGAALVDSYGLNCLIDDTNPIYGEKDFPQINTDIYCYQIYLDLNGVLIHDGDEFDIIQILDGASPRTKIELGWNSFFNHTIRAAIYDDSVSAQFTDTHAISDAPHLIEIRITYASSAVASDAELIIWIDGVLEETVSGVDLFDLSKPNKARIGVIDVDAATITKGAGTIYIDDILINTDCAGFSTTGSPWYYYAQM